MTEKMHFEILINAPVQKVWDIMLTQATYKQWTSAFEPTSYFEGSWEKGSQIKFLGAGGGGMISEIAENIPHKFVSIKHLGVIAGVVVDTTSEEVKKWAPSFENYTFVAKGADTQLEIDIDTTPEFKEMFEDTWPNALWQLKEICEK